MNKFFQIQKEHIPYFKELDFYDALDQLVWPDYFAIGATIQNDEDGKDHPVGLMVARIDEDRIVITWLYVSEMYRGLDIGSGFVSLMFKESKARGFDTLSVRIPAIYEKNGLPWNPRGFFGASRFATEEVELPEWNFFAASLYGRKDIFLRTKKMDDIRPFSELSDESLKRLYQMVAKKHGSSLPYDIHTIRPYVDRELSYVLIDNKEVKGIIFVQKTGNNIYPIYFDADEKRAPGFIADIFEMSEDYVSVNDRVHIVPRRPLPVKAIRQVELTIPSWDVVNMVAKVEDHIGD